MSSLSADTATRTSTSFTRPLSEALRRDLQADVCVVGAGIAGLTTAWLLAREGRDVTVLDDGAFCADRTSCTKARVSTALDERWFEIARLHGTAGARQLAESRRAALAQLQRIVTEERIRCEFARLDGFVFLPPDQPQALLVLELQAAVDAGLDVQRVERAPIDGFDTGSALRFAGQAELHPRKYLAGLARAVQRRGGRIFGARTTAMHGDVQLQLETVHGPVVSARTVVVATNTPVSDRVNGAAQPLAEFTCWIAARIPQGALARAHYWDNEEPRHYLRLGRRETARGSEGGELLFIGGESYRNGHAPDARQRFARLEAWARARFPALGEIEFRGSGPAPESVDDRASIGRSPLDPENVFVASGVASHDPLQGTIAGLLLADLITARTNRWSSLYDPSSRSLPGARQRVVFERRHVADATRGETPPPPSQPTRPAETPPRRQPFETEPVPPAPPGAPSAPEHRPMERPPDRPFETPPVPPSGPGLSVIPSPRAAA